MSFPAICFHLIDAIFRWRFRFCHKLSDTCAIFERIHTGRVFLGVC